MREQTPDYRRGPEFAIDPDSGAECYFHRTVTSSRAVETGMVTNRSVDAVKRMLKFDEERDGKRVEVLAIVVTNAVCDEKGYVVQGDPGKAVEMVAGVLHT